MPQCVEADTNPSQADFNTSPPLLHALPIHIKIALTRIYPLASGVGSGTMGGSAEGALLNT